MNKTLTTMLVTLRHAREKLGPFHALDEAGAKLLHDANNAINHLEAALRGELAPEYFRQLVNTAAAVQERITDHVLKRRAPPREPRRDRNTPTPEEQQKIAEAQAGPAAETMESCPACLGCTLCGDHRFVTVSTAVAWRKRNTPKRKR